MDGSGYLFGALNTEADVSIVKSGGNKCVELGPLASAGLLYTGALFKTSSSRVHAGKKPMLSEPLMGRRKRQISSTDLVFLSLTR